MTKEVYEKIKKLLNTRLIYQGKIDALKKYEYFSLECCKNDDFDYCKKILLSKEDLVPIVELAENKLTEIEKELKELGYYD